MTLDIQPPAPPPLRSRFTYGSGARPLAGYTLKRGIGAGGFGEVYFATSDGGKEVALKLIRRNLDVELRGVSHCLNLKHPHLLALYDVRRDDQGDAWVVMEYVPGASLEQVIAQHATGMPEDQVLTWIAGIAAGVAYLHDKGVVHRDLKPGNIFCDEGVVKIGDYGLSKFISCSRRSGQTESVGTVHYMAPEISNGRYGKEIDLYALGIILYEMLTGNVPFEGESVGEVLMKHLTAEPDVSGLTEPYRSIVRRALAKDPALRFPSVQEFSQALPQQAHPTTLIIPAIAASGGGDVPPVVPVMSPLPAMEIPTEEPLWRALREAWDQLGDAWHRARIPMPVKVMLVVAGIFVVLRTAEWTLPALAGGLLAYGMYRLTRAILLERARAKGGILATPARAAPPSDQSSVTAHTIPPPPPLAGPLAPMQSPPAVPRRGRFCGSPFAHTLPLLPAKTFQERLTDLLGSLLVAAGVSAAAALVMMLFSREDFQQNRFAWMAIVGTLGSWSVLIPSKWWEGRRGEALVRRGALLVAGLLVGMAGYFLDQSLLVQLSWLPPNPNVPPLDGYRLSLVSAAGQPLLKGYLVYFGLLFCGLRWWRQSDPLRSTRLNIWHLLLCVIWAWFLGQVWPFPATTGVMVATTASLAIQLASPWVGPRKL